jgi:hypothetical protein
LCHHLHKRILVTAETGVWDASASLTGTVEPEHHLAQLSLRQRRLGDRRGHISNVRGRLVEVLGDVNLLRVGV